MKQELWLVRLVSAKIVLIGEVMTGLLPILDSFVRTCHSRCSRGQVGVVVMGGVVVLEVLYGRMAVTHVRAVMVVVEEVPDKAINIISYSREW